MDVSGIAKTVGEWFGLSPEADQKKAEMTKTPSAPALPDALPGTTVSSTAMHELDRLEEEQAEIARREAEAARSRRRKAVKDSADATMGFPGRYDDIDREARPLLFMDTFTGMRFELNKMLSGTAEKSFLYSHSLAVGDEAHPEGTYDVGPILHFDGDSTVLMGRLGSNGSLQGRFNQKWGRGLSSQFSFFLTPKSETNAPMMFAHPRFSGQLDLNKDGEISNTRFRVASGMFSIAYLQSISPCYSVGTELMHSYAQGMTMMSMVGRYDDNRNVIFVRASPFESVVGYTRAVAENAAFTADYKFASVQLVSEAAIGYRHSVRSGQYRGSISSSGNVSMIIDYMINPMIRLSLSTQINYFDKSSKVGVGLSVG